MFYVINIIIINVDYIIVGLGLAGLSFAEMPIKHNKNFLIFDDTSQRASVATGGMYNPKLTQFMRRLILSN